MRVSLKWLAELVDIPLEITPNEIAEHLTMAGLEVEAMSSVSGEAKGIVIGKVAEIPPLQEGKDVSVCQVDIGSGLICVVTTSKSLSMGDMVAVAPVGATLFNGVKIEPRVIAGVESQGLFLCERDLGISEEHSDVLVLSDKEFKNFMPGTDAVEALGLSDTIFEIAITPNRSDALSHIGVARELAAILQARSKLLATSCREFSGPIHDVLLVNIEAKEACPRYAARVIENIQVSKSPLWIRQRLFACGIRPINNVVDITNLVLLERGHPLHAFDFQKLFKDRGRATLNIRFAVSGEKIKTLDGIERKLHNDDLVIADAKGPVALAGVMGGEFSEVDDGTSTVVLESAYFEPTTVRKSARRHQLSTEASYRFERGADPNGVIPALDKAADLMVQCASGKVRREAIDVYPTKIDNVEILLRPKKLQEISGLPQEDLDEAKIRSRFASLGIETVGRRGEALCFRAPTFRPDLTREIDLIEEAMRLVGYAKVPTVSVFGRKTSVALSNERFDRAVENIRHSLKASGYFGALNYSFGSPRKYKAFEDEPEHSIYLQNPLGEELSLMRRSLLPGLLDNVGLNLRKGALGVKLFEIGTVFLGKNQDGTLPDASKLSSDPSFDAWAIEKTHVAGVCTGLLESTGVNEKERPFDFYDAKGAVENLLKVLRVDTDWRSNSLEFQPIKDESKFLHRGFSARIVLNKVSVGFVGRIHPDVQDEFELKLPVYCFEIDVRSLLALTNDDIAMKPMPRYPEVSRDIALLISEQISASQITQVVKENPQVSNLLEDFKIFDIYAGKGIPEGKKSVALSFLFRSAERTLKDEEVQTLMESLIEGFKVSFDAQIRS